MTEKTVVFELPLVEREIEICKRVLSASPSSCKELNEIFSNNNLWKHTKDENFILSYYQIYDLHRSALDTYHNHKCDMREEIWVFNDKLVAILFPQEMQS